MKRYIPEEEVQSDVITFFGFVSPDTVHTQIMYLAPLKVEGYETEFVVKDIDVILMENNQVLDTLVTENGIDYTLSSPIQLDPGIPYYIRIARNDQIIIFTDPVYIPEPLKLDTLTNRLDDRLELNAIIRDMPAEYLNVKVHMFTTRIVGRSYEHNIPRFIDNGCNLRNSNPIRKECFDIYGIDTLKIGIQNALIQNIPSDTLFFSFRGVDKWYYSYFNSLIQDYDVELGLQEPVPAKGNVHGGFGMLGAYNELIYKVHK